MKRVLGAFGRFPRLIRPRIEDIHRGVCAFRKRRSAADAGKVVVLAIDADHQIVLFAEEVEAAGNESVVESLFGVVIVVVVEPVRPGHRDRIQRTIRRRDLVELFEPTAGAAHGQFPIAAEMLFQPHEILVRVGLVGRPVGVQRGTARQADIAAIRVTRQAAAPGVAITLLETAADDQQRALAQIRFRRGVGEAHAFVDVVDERTSIPVRGHQPATQRAAEPQRRPGIDRALIPVPASAVELHAHGGLRRRALAHQIHHAARLAVAGEQPVGAAQDFHLLEGEQIGS